MITKEITMNNPPSGPPISRTQALVACAVAMLTLLLATA
jgi:hypothetical protein